MADLTLQPVPDPPTADLVAHLVRRRFLGEQGDEALARTAAEAMVVRIRDRATHHRVVAGDTPVGHLWLVEQGDDLSVLALTLDDAAHAPAVRGLVERVAADGGARRLTVGVRPGDLVTVGFCAGAGFAVSATQMRLDLDHDLPAEDVVTLGPMDQAAYDIWAADGIETYAAERALAGEDPDRARQVSEEQHAELLPDGLATEQHHFFVGRVEGTVVGTLWIGTERPMAFVYDVVVDETRRGRGYGAGLMRAGALWAQARGAHALGLNVFGHNHGARALYDKLGYHVVEEYVGKSP